MFASGGYKERAVIGRAEREKLNKKEKASPMRAKVANGYAARKGIQAKAIGEKTNRPNLRGHGQEREIKNKTAIEKKTSLWVSRHPRRQPPGVGRCI